ncbi:hypothetical protein [Pseudophaeobacter sp.]|uniref:hypothetical protein n=1 Tax=Pseudophaeobacter sp. TaxID=1971739 RepID=UPI0032998D06
MTFDALAFLENGQFEKPLRDAKLPDWRNFYKIYDCAQNATEWWPNPLYFETDVFGSGNERQVFRATHFMAPVFWSKRHGVLDMITGVHEASTGVPDPVLEKGSRTIRYPFTRILSGPTVVPGPRLSNTTVFPPSRSSGGDPDPLNDAAIPLGVPLYPQLPADLWDILQGNPDLMVYQSASAPSVLSLHRRHWVYDEWMFLSQATTKLRALYRLDSVDIGQYSSDSTWVMAFDAAGGALQMVSEADYTVSYEFPLGDLNFGSMPVKRP